MKTSNGLTTMNVTEFETWIKKLAVTRNITRIQIHHTYQPGYTEWNKKPDALYWQQAMKNYHVNTNGWADIAQHLTICPDGQIVTGRSFNSNPAGITGANTGAICIENLGNFDKSGDTMTAAQANAIVVVVASLLKRFGLTTGNITYHCWWTSSGSYIGTYNSSKSAKTCPGTNFFGGNTMAAFNDGFRLKVQKYMDCNTRIKIPEYGEEALSKLVAKKLISNTEIWRHFSASAQTAPTLALIDKATGGIWTSDEQDCTIHWAQPHIISLCGKKVIEDYNQWVNKLDSSISSALFLALIDKATGGMKSKYATRKDKVDHWGRNHLDSLCDKGLITTPEAWTNFEGEITRANVMALIVNAFVD